MLEKDRGHKIVENDDVYILKKCPEHGEFKVLVWRDYELYKKFEDYACRGRKPKPEAITKNIERGCPFDCGLCPNHLQDTALSF